MNFYIANTEKDGNSEKHHQTLARWEKHLILKGVVNFELNIMKKKCLNSAKKLIYFICNLTNSQVVVIFDFNMGNIGLNCMAFKKFELFFHLISIICEICG